MEHRDQRTAQVQPPAHYCGVCDMTLLSQWHYPQQHWNPSSQAEHLCFSLFWASAQHKHSSRICISISQVRFRLSGSLDEWDTVVAISDIGFGPCRHNAKESPRVHTLEYPPSIWGAAAQCSETNPLSGHCISACSHRDRMDSLA